MEDLTKIYIKMVKGTLLSFVVAVIFMLAYLITFQPVFAILSIFMALFGALLLLFGLKDKTETQIEDEEYDEDEEYEDDDDDADDYDEEGNKIEN